MASKQNDLMLNILANPHMNLGDFQSVGLSADNTSLEDENTYLNSKMITENPLFQNASGEFDKIKFHQKYLEAAQALQNMSENGNFQATYSKYNIFAPVNQIDTTPQFELTKASNPVLEESFPPMQTLLSCAIAAFTSLIICPSEA